MSKVKTKSEVVFDKLVDAKEAYTAKKVRALKKVAAMEKSIALGPPKPTAAAKSAPAAKPHRSRSEAAKAAWAAHRDTITAGINKFFAQRKPAAKPKPKAKKVAAQDQAQA
ncbi:MAG TPA: hypothetical protein VMW46_03230 [Candidatus Desulfaltia sp.]|nr:hypothetical protein [Candidatus Desulfaltia sp.]